MDVRSLGFQTDLMIRRLAGAEVDDRGDHIVVRTRSNPTFWWGNFILVGADFGNAQRWLDAFSAAHPDASHVAIGLDAVAATAEILAGYEAAGLERDVATVLVASTVDEPTASPDTVSRPLAEDGDWQQALELMLAVNGDDDRLFIERKLLEWRRLAEAGHGAWYGAFVAGHMRCSLGLLTDGHGLGRYQSVETHPDYRRRGLARQLTAAAAKDSAIRFGVASLVIVADPEYHAATLYRSLGFRDRDVQIQVARG